jgi:Uncharacterised nucleotidyltransferase
MRRRSTATVVSAIVTVAVPNRKAVARCLAADVAAAEAVRALRCEGVHSILLKGPAVARALYGPAEVRAYADADLLVAPVDERRAADVLGRLGYSPLVEDAALKGHRPLHAREWVRADAASIDLHRTLAGAEAPPERVFAEISQHTQPVAVAGEEVEGLDAAALALELALHVAHHGAEAGKAAEDLRRGVTRLATDDWEDAARIARRIDALGALAAGLRAIPEGQPLAVRLCPDARLPVHVALHAAGAPPLAAGIDWLGQTPGAIAKGALLARTFVPAPGALRLWRPLARRGRTGLVAAYATQPFWLAAHAVPSWLAVRRVRREAA